MSSMGTPETLRFPLALPAKPWLDLAVGTTYRKTDGTFGQLDFALDDRGGVAVTCNCLGVVYTETRELERAAAHLQESLSLWKAIGDEASYARSLMNLAMVRRLQGEHERRQRETALAALMAVHEVGHMGVDPALAGFLEHTRPRGIGDDQPVLHG